MLHAFIYGFILALGLITPLGAQNVFLFNQGASQNRFFHSLPSILSASICDIILILAAVLGVSIAVMKLIWLKDSVLLLGSIFLIYMGWLSWRRPAIAVHEQQNPLSAKRQISFTLSVSLLNPHAIIDSFGVLGTSALHFSGHARWSFTAACLLVSVAWFFGIAYAGHRLRSLDKTGNLLMFINKFSALVMWSVASLLLCQLFSTTSLSNI